jgi:hypothetical protein
VTEPGEDRRLVLVRGEATAEEVAALVAVLQARPPATHAPPPVVAEWSAPHRKVRVTYPHGRGGWRSSALPRPR